MRKLVLIICAIVLLCSCSSSDVPDHNKVTTCEYETTSEDITTKTNLKAYFMDGDLVSGNLEMEMTYASQEVAKIAYSIYTEEQDEDHQVEIILDDNKIIMRINYPSNTDDQTFISKITSLTWKNACSTKVTK